jgi:hypothetical protein
MSGGGERLLLLRSGGGLWGVDQAAVREVSRRERGYCVRLAGEHDLHADDVVGVVEGVAVRPAGGTISRYWSEAAAGLAVHAATPLVVVDAERPPRFLRVPRTEETESDDGDDRRADD